MHQSSFKPCESAQAPVPALKDDGAGLESWQASWEHLSWFSSQLTGRQNDLKGKLASSAIRSRHTNFDSSSKGCLSGLGGRAAARAQAAATTIS